MTWFPSFLVSHLKTWSLFISLWYDIDLLLIWSPSSLLPHPLCYYSSFVFFVEEILLLLSFFPSRHKSLTDLMLTRSFLEQLAICVSTSTWSVMRFLWCRWLDSRDTDSRAKMLHNKPTLNQTRIPLIHPFFSLLKSRVWKRSFHTLPCRLWWYFMWDVFLSKYIFLDVIHDHSLFDWLFWSLFALCFGKEFSRHHSHIVYDSMSPAAAGGVAEAFFISVSRDTSVLRKNCH